MAHNARTKYFDLEFSHNEAIGKVLDGKEQTLEFVDAFLRGFREYIACEAGRLTHSVKVSNDTRIDLVMRVQLPAPHKLLEPKMLEMRFQIEGIDPFGPSFLVIEMNTGIQFPVKDDATREQLYRQIVAAMLSQASRL